LPPLSGIEEEEEFDMDRLNLRRMLSTLALSNWLEPLLAVFHLHQQLFRQLRMQLVATTMTYDVAYHFAAGQRQVANYVEQFVTHALVLKAQLVIDRSVWTKDQQVARRDALAQALGAHALSRLFWNKRAARRQLAAKGTRRYID
jgi:hypothetical protein